MSLAGVQKAKSVKSNAMSSTLRCFQVLELLAEEPFELTVSDIAEVLAMPRASAHRLCATLVEGGFVEQVASNKRYRLTSKSLWVGSGYLRHSAIYRAAFFPMQELAKQIPGTAQLGVYSEGKVLDRRMLLPTWGSDEHSMQRHPASFFWQICRYSKSSG
jgi:hypothetical protein